MELNVETIIKLGLKEKYKLFLMYAEDYFKEKSITNEGYKDLYIKIIESVEIGVDEKFNIHLVFSQDIKAIKGDIESIMLIGGKKMTVSKFNKELLNREMLLDKWLISIFDKKRIWSEQI